LRQQPRQARARAAAGCGRARPRRLTTTRAGGGGGGRAKAEEAETGENKGKLRLGGSGMAKKEARHGKIQGDGERQGDGKATARFRERQGDGKAPRRHRGEARRRQGPPPTQASRRGAKERAGKGNRLPYALRPVPQARMPQHGTRPPPLPYKPEPLCRMCAV
jgi:hypothetical protein